MPAAIDRYAPVLAAPTCLEDFDTAIGAEVRHQREEWIMRRGG